MMTCIEKEWRRAYLLLEMAPTDVTPMLLTALASYSSLGGKGGLMVVIVMMMVMVMMMMMVIVMVMMVMIVMIMMMHFTRCNDHNMVMI